MAENETTEERRERSEERRPSGLDGVSSQYRMAAGLGERTSDEPTPVEEAISHQRAYEPEGGYGGEGGIRNTAATNGSEQARADLREEQLAAREERVEETGLTGGETATEVALSTGEDVTDVKPGPDSVVDEEAELEDEEK